MNFTRLRLSSSPAVSAHIIDAPSSPTKSVYLDMDETTPISPQVSSDPYTLSDTPSARTSTTNTTTNPPAATATAAPQEPPSARRTNFFDSDSSEDEAGGDTDDLAFSQRHSLVSASPAPGLGNHLGDAHRGRSRARSPYTPRSGSATQPAGRSSSSRSRRRHRKDACYLGVRPEEYAFMCGTRPTSSVIVMDAGEEEEEEEEKGGGDGGPRSPLLGSGYDGYTRYDVPSPPRLSLGHLQQQRQTLRPEGSNPKHVPFGAPDLAVAARRVLAERDRRRREGPVELARGRESSSIVPPSVSEYDEDMSVEGRSVSFRGRGGEGGVGMGSPARSGEKGVVSNGVVAGTQFPQSKTDDNILGVHAITLQALLRNEEGLQMSVSSVRRKSTSSEFSRREILKLQGKLLQQPQDSVTSLPPPVPEITPMVQIQSPKRVAVVPPPIDINRSRESRGEKKVKTPYPFHHHKNLPKTLGSPGFPPPKAKDIVLTLSIRRRKGVLSTRVARLLLPAELLEGNYYTANSFSDDIAPDERPPPVFDDAAFFKQLRTDYAHLAGRWWRFFSARSLHRITVGHTTAWSATESCPGPSACGGGGCCPAAQAAHGGSGPLQLRQHRHGGCSAATPSGIYHVRSPRFLASQGLKDTFSEENLLAHFRNPHKGRSRFAWVLWASRLAGLHEQPDLSSWRAVQRQWPRSGDLRDRELPPTPSGGVVGKSVDASGHTPSTTTAALAGGGSDSESKDDVFVVNAAAAELGIAGEIGPGHSVATLEFVEGWSVGRILAAVLLVLLLAAAGIVLWILFGSGVLVEGFRGSGARVGTAVLIGAGVLLFGWTLVLAWMGVSWCVV